MAARDEVRSYQRRMADLDTACQRARNRLEAARARRDDVIERQDRLVEQARSDWQSAIRDLAEVFGAYTTAAILGLDAGEVSRAIKATAPSSAGPRAR
jgi:hypothetical protein